MGKLTTASREGNWIGYSNYLCVMHNQKHSTACACMCLCVQARVWVLHSTQGYKNGVCLLKTANAVWADINGSKSSRKTRRHKQQHLKFLPFVLPDASVYLLRFVPAFQRWKQPLTLLSSISIETPTFHLIGCQSTRPAASSVHRGTLWPHVNHEPVYRWPKHAWCTGSRRWGAGRRQGGADEYIWREKQREQRVCLTFLALVFCYMRKPRGSGIEGACPPPPCTHAALSNICLGHLSDDLPGPIKHEGDEDLS